MLIALCLKVITIVAWNEKKNTFFSFLKYGRDSQVHIWPCENVSSGKCGQLRPRLSYASAQSHQGYHCPLTVIAYYRLYEWQAKAQMILCACAGCSEYVYLAHVRRHVFAKRSPFDGTFAHLGHCLRNHNVRKYGICKLVTNGIDLDPTVRMHRAIWVCA